MDVNGQDGQKGKEEETEEPYLLLLSVCASWKTRDGNRAEGGETEIKEGGRRSPPVMARQAGRSQKVLTGEITRGKGREERGSGSGRHRFGRGREISYGMDPDGH